MLPTLHRLAADLASGATTSLDLTEAALARIADPAGEGTRSFTRFYPEAARAAASASDALRRCGQVPSSLAGIPISIKDLFDVAGETTLAGSRALDDAAPAAADAPVVARLRAAGAILIGKTVMTEFAYSGLGLNPHYGTPRNPLDPARIPGGSSSGAGVAPRYGFAAASIGTDTGGSVRIPAAFCGLAGFKPTAARVPRAGTIPLSTTLDSIGPLAPSVACCALLDAILAGEAPGALPNLPLAGLRLAVPLDRLTEGLDAPVTAAFLRALRLLADSGARVTEIRVPEFARIDRIGQWGAPAAVEAYTWHRRLMARRGGDYDPRVIARLRAAAGIAAADYLDGLAERSVLQAEFGRRMAGFDAVLAPTVAIIPPLFAELETDEAYARLNGLVLRNTATFNLLDWCALSIPCFSPGEAPVGLMIAGPQGADHRILSIGQAIEAALDSPLKLNLVLAG